MSSRMCELCRKRPADMICIRCRRAVCSDCMTELWLCKECYTYREAIRMDRMRIVRYIEKLTEACSERARNRRCANCTILREMLLSLYKMLRDLMNEARVEYYEDVIESLEKIEPKLRRILIRVLVIQGGLRLGKEDEESEISLA